MSVGANWLNAQDYPGSKTALSRWAWEFLRRNPEYRDDWRKYTDRCTELRAKYRGEIEAADREPTEFAFSHDDPLGCVYEPPQLAGETDNEWIQRVRKGKRSPLGNWLCNKWGIRGQMVDPEAHDFRCLWASSSKTVHQVLSMPEGSPIVTTTPAFQFDITRAIKPQLQYIEQQLRSLQQHFKTANGRAQAAPIYQRYLRALDAREAGASITNIGAELFPNDSNEYPTCPRDKKVRAMIHTAQELRDHGYRRLPGLAEEPLAQK